MKHQFDQNQLDAAWQSIESEIKSARLVGPAAGFTNRFRGRLLMHKKKMEQQEAYRVVFLNVFGAVIVLGILVARTFMAYDSTSDFLGGLVDMISGFWVSVQMLVGIMESLGRAMTGLVPLSTWGTLIASGGGLMMIWISSLKNSLQRAGVYR